MLSMHVRHRLHEGMFVVVVAFAIFLLISICTFHAADPGWSSTGFGGKILNWGGRVGAWMADVMLSLFGVVAFVFPFLLVISSWLRLRQQDEREKKSYEWILTFFGWVFLVASSCGLASFYFASTKVHMPAKSGGIIGDLLGSGLALLFNQTGSTLLFIATLLSGITLITGLSWLVLTEWLGEKTYMLLGQVWGKRPALEFSWRAWLPKKGSTTSAPPVIEPLARREPVIAQRPAPVVPPVISKPMVVRQLEAPREKKKMVIDSKIKLKPGALPPLSLLNMPPVSNVNTFSSTSFEELSQLVEQRLADFGVDVKVVAVHPGPVVTRFELDLAPGIKVSKITGLAKDIARSLSAVSVRIVEVIPGKSVIGLEIPNEHREIVVLREILESQRYVQARSAVSLVLGKDISGNPVVVDLAKMPHLLVAGTTGSGKSVSLNAMLLSLLYKSTPEQLRLILIDPKMLELSVYDGIPHLLTPVITDMKEAANSLRWCVAEMDKRYRLMAALGVRNLASYNQKVNEAIRLGEPLMMPGVLVTDEESAKQALEPLPTIVLVADELADMMMVVGKKIEDLIARLAQKARAAGIHLILATQRPSVDVITGLIKANIPTRIAFQVSSRIDSRTILDQQGAEQLLGHGDMLYLPPGAGVPVRVHGAYVEDEEVHRVVAAWRTSGEPEYLADVVDDAADSGAGGEQGTGERDPLYDDAVRIVTESRRASISLVQRRLRIGYNRAARMMEEMEAAGVVSTSDHHGAREVLAAGAPVD